MIWKKRFVKLEDGNVFISREDDHEDFDFGKEDDKAAFCFNMGSDKEISSLGLKHEELFVYANGHNYWLRGSNRRTMTLINCK